MRSLANPKPKGIGRANPHQAAFELKQRVASALNKLSDRDTYQIGSEELERIAFGLAGPEPLAALLSCVLETDSEQKSLVRKECVRVMGTLAKSHGAIVAPHLPKMVGSIVKRLKDSDSVVRDACVETVGVLASKMSGGDDMGNGCFVMLVKPLFEVLGEQNKHVQTGSALCLASIVDNATDPPAPVLLRMLVRSVKLMKNQHFMGKPALIELLRSIIQAGGASTEQAMSSAMNSIQDALKSSDWTTRKSASTALAGIAACGGSSLGSFKPSCIRALESCRFDKVKPVRDSVMQALQYWKKFPSIHSPEPSEVGSSTKGDLTDIASVSGGGWKDTSSRKVNPVNSTNSVFMGGSMDSLSILQSKVLNLENAVDGISRDLSHIGNYSNYRGSGLSKKNQSVSSSPRLSTCTPRSSVDAYSRQSSVSSMKSKELWEETAPRSRLSTSVRENSELWGDPTFDISKNPIAKCAGKSSARLPQNSGRSQMRKADPLPASACKVNANSNVSESKVSFWRHVKDFLYTGDLESAYVEALCSGDDLLVIELMDTTGPVLERLSHETASEILSTVVARLVNQGFLSSIIPWLQQASNTAI
ncbi:Microtubule-associated protein TORTIFOLIA1 [Acorus gramineus]|uniref:Microtubule-associated protein TORTIFOLIA1 n=1 Tax=Acorus gramineus TaxID=55184 RepID=A0AAV9BIT4_ACOGR|nr:Microtubule-associated protein TORTIFOLIA1 [Acorus gramineus]